MNQIKLFLIFLGISLFLHLFVQAQSIDLADSIVAKVDNILIPRTIIEQKIKD